MTHIYYVCRQCNYKHTFLPIVCAKCKGSNFYPLITSEPTGNTSIRKGIEIQEDVLKLRIENEQLKEQNTNLQIMLKAEREVRCNDDYLKRVCELEEQLEQAKEMIKKLLNYIFTPEEFENGEVIKQAEQFLKE